MKHTNLLAAWTTRMGASAMEKLYRQAIERKVAFVPGKFFYAHGGEGNATMRLNYTMADEETIERAIKILADVLRRG